MPRKKSSACVIAPQGALDITQARSLRDELLAAFETADTVTLRLDAISEADMSFFQLLFAAHHEAAARGKKLLIEGDGIQEPVRRLMVDGGIVRHFDCQHVKGQRCFWCGEGW